MHVQLNAKQKSLHERAVYLARRSSNLEYARMENLIDIEANEVHKAFGKKMFVYATEVLEMDPNVAYPYIAVARSCVRFPALRIALKCSLTVSKAARIVSALNPENAEELIQFAQTHSKQEIEEEIARRNPKPGTRDRIRPLNGEYDELKVRMSKKVSQSLKRVQSLNPSLDLSRTIEEVIEFYLNHKDPVRKAERAAAKKDHAKKDIEKNDVEKQPSGQKFSPGRKRVPLSAAEQHAVNIRDRGRCTFVEPDGKRCDSDRWTENHHIVPVSLGGTNDPDNVTTLCSFHHDLVHQLSLPMDGQVTWLR